MKKLLTIMILTTLMIGCKKKATAPQQAANNPPQVTAATLTSLDSCMIGDWKLDSTQIYNNGTYLQTDPYNDATNCHLLMNSTEVTLGDPSLWKKGVTGLDCSNTSMQWRITSGKLDIYSNLYQIVSSGNNKLVILHGSISVSAGIALRYYLHK